MGEVVLWSELYGLLAVTGGRFAALTNCTSGLHVTIRQRLLSYNHCTGRSDDTWLPTEVFRHVSTVELLPQRRRHEAAGETATARSNLSLHRRGGR